MKFNVMPGKEGYSVPPGYFKGLQDRVLSTVHEEEANKPAFRARLIGLFQRPVMAYAALLAAALIAVTVLIDRPDNTDIFADISEDAAYEYVYSNIQDYSTEDLYGVAGTPVGVDALDDLSSEQINIALDEILDEIDPTDLDELF